MPEISRRRFIRDASISAAAAGTAVTFAPGLVAGASAATAPSATTAPNSSTAGPVLAYLVDASTGELAVLVGTREMRVFDKSFAQKLKAAAK